MIFSDGSSGGKLRAACAVHVSPENRVVNDRYRHDDLVWSSNMNTLDG